LIFFKMEEERIFVVFFSKWKRRGVYIGQNILGEEENLIQTQRNRLGHQETSGSSKLGDQVCFRSPARYS